MPAFLQIRYLQQQQVEYKGLGGILSENVNRRSMDSSGVKVTYQPARTQSYKSGPINFSQDVLSESKAHFQVDNTTALSYLMEMGGTGSREMTAVTNSIVFDGNGWDWKQRDDSCHQGNLGICSITEDHNYCRVSAREIEYESRLGVQEFSGFKIGIDRYICLQSLPSTSHIYGLETRPSQSGNRCSPTEMEKPGTSICFPP